MRKQQYTVVFLSNLLGISAIVSSLSCNATLNAALKTGVRVINDRGTYNNFHCLVVLAAISHRKGVMMLWKMLHIA